MAFANLPKRKMTARSYSFKILSAVETIYKKMIRKKITPIFKGEKPGIFFTSLPSFGEQPPNTYLISYLALIGWSYNLWWYSFGPLSERDRSA
jgi:hypothetical protein